MFRKLVYSVILFCGLLGAAAWSQAGFGLPEIGIQTAGSCRLITVRDHGGQQTPIGCLDDIRHWFSQPGSIRMFGGVPDGSDITTSLVNANAAAVSFGGGKIRLEHGTYTLGNDATISNGVVLDPGDGGLISIASTKTLTIHGTIPKDIYRQIFTGSGIATGAAFARPDWYGCTGTADNVCIQKAINSVEISFGSDGDKRQIGFGCKIYKVSAGFTISPTNLWNHYDHGCGSGNGGTTFEVQAGFSGLQIVIVAGQPRGTPGVVANYDIGDFLVTNPSNVPGLTCVAFAPTAGTQLEGNKPNLFSNVDCQGTKFGRTYGAVREQLVDRFGFHSSEHGAFCAVYIPNDKFSVVGDLNAINQTCAPNGGTTLVTSGDTTDTGYAYFGTRNGGGITGISEAGDFYASNLGFQFQAQRNLADLTDNANIGISDIFLGEGSKTEIDGFQCGVVTMTADSTGTAANQRVYVSNVQLRAKYIRGVVPGCVMWNATTVGSGSGTATIDSLDFNAKFAANIGGYGTIWNNVRGGQIHAKWMDSGHVGTYAIKLLGSTSGVSIFGNVCSYKGGNPTFTYDGFILLEGAADYNAVSQDDITDGGCGVPVVNNSTGTHNVLQDGTKFLYPPIFSTLGTGLLKGNGSGPISIAIPGTDYVAGTANPTATIGLSAVNGSAGTGMRSDAAPPLSQSISPTWSGTHTFLNPPIFTTLTGYLKGNGASALTASSTVPYTDISGTFAVGDMLYASSTTALARLAAVATGNVLRSGGVGAAPAWGKVNLSTDLDANVLPATNSAALSGDVTKTAGANNTVYNNVVPAAKGGAGTVTGALKANGSGTVSQAACADLLNGAASCSSDTTNAGNIASGTLGGARLPAPSSSVFGGVKSLAAAATKFLTSIGTDGIPVAAQPNFTDLAGTVAATQLGGMSAITNSLGADVVLNNTGTYFTGPTIAQGSTGAWYVSGSVTMTDTAGSAIFACKLWDGTTIIDSGLTQNLAATNAVTIALSGYMASPAGNLRISCIDVTSANGFIRANQSGNAKDSTISAFRIN